HSKRGSVELDALAAFAEAAGGSPALREKISAANTAAEAFAHAAADGVALGDEVARAAQATALEAIGGTGIAVAMVLLDRAGALVGHAPFESAHDPLSSLPRKARRRRA